MDILSTLRVGVRAATHHRVTVDTAGTDPWVAHAKALFAKMQGEKV